MSDIREYGSPLEHHVLEALAFQWDGSDGQAARLTADLVRELQPRDGRVTRANHHRGSSSAQLTFELQRRSDGQVFRDLMIRKGEWLVVWLHKDRIHDAEKMTERQGMARFRPVTPVIRLDLVRRELPHA